MTFYTLNQIKNYEQMALKQGNKMDKLKPDGLLHTPLKKIDHAKVGIYHGIKKRG